MSQGGSIVSGVAGRYATALFELAVEANSVDSISADLDRFEALIAESADLARLVRVPVFTAEQQLNAITAVLEKAGIGGWAGKFIRLVASKRRLFLIHEIIKAYKALVAESRGIVRAEVTVAEEPSAKVLEDIKTALKSAANGGEIVLDVRVDPAILGGLVVKLGSRMVDASLRYKLNSIRLALKEVG
ncbi:F-type H+-transporting ATPase subunit delta [Pseudochelatococcus lubricantis]|uniref:ATP synthase subunit delta n=1 Tax=Pseudochelatococcus lubricantis TaxID=1538102 RepID=A0ABX0V4S0_9HYPH|nr:F-type H+-transporting ATPase subunit delta [Pseudochelatococcus lubricantis]